MRLKKTEILKFLRDQAGRPLLVKEIQNYLGIARDERQELKRLLNGMVNSSDLVKIRGGRYGIPSKMNLVTGILQGHPDGYGFVMPGGDEKDVYVNGRKLKDAMHGDRVTARVEGTKPGGKREGSIIRVLERAHKTVVGRYEKGKKFGYVVPRELRITHDIYIPKDESMGAEDGELVVAEISVYPSNNRSPEGRIIQVLGSPDNAEVEIQSVIAEFNLPAVFPDEVVEEAIKAGEAVSESDVAKRVDLRQMTTVTIDGETARDFDDAVAVRREKNGNIRLWVSIADVSHYVKEGSALDKEAYARSTSVYFPDRCIPMLPENLSNGICSLNPEVDRLAFTAEMEFNDKGQCVDKSFYPSVINSNFRLTYTIVKKILVDGDGSLKEKYASILQHLNTMEELCDWLKSYRKNRGCIDFDLPEAQIVLDIQGGVEAIVRSERNLAHMIIEEFMLATNEAVASYLTRKKRPLLYRVHDEPEEEKISDFKEFIHNFGYHMKGEKTSAKELSRVLGEVSGKPEERTINHVLLRSMKQAEYNPVNVGHFGLASKEYCHFTSPIRRYPDLVVHRILKKALTHKRLDDASRDKEKEQLRIVGEETSTRERRAMEAEREIVSFLKTGFMVDKVGETYSGFITGVTSFGLFVELEELFVEGLIHVTSLHDDYYLYDEKGHMLTGERRGKTFRIGDEITVYVDRVDVEKRQIDFKLA
ncbi:MAG: ribonuclease R [Proteobacteria bacterium]|nr:ribonuclease R [Pseudomonadota bacterium]